MLGVWSVRLLKQIPIVKSCIEKWRKQPPKTTGGIYYSDNENLQRCGWKSFVKSRDFELLRKHIQYLLDEGLLLTSFYHCNIRAIDLIWFNKDGTGPHVEEAEVAPAGFAVISLAQYMESSFADFEDEGYYTLKLESLSSSNASSMDLKVEVNDIYSLEGAALKDFTHGTRLQDGSLGKVHLRVSFADDDNLSELITRPEHYPDIARELSDLEENLWLEASYNNLRDHLSTENVTLPEQPIPQRSPGSGIEQCLWMTEDHKKDVAKLVKDPKYYVDKTDPKWRSAFSKDIQDMKPLHLDLLADPPNLDHKSNTATTSIGGSVYGGRCYSQDKACKKLALDCWEFAKQWPAARTRFWHTDAADNYMTKMVLHLDGPGLATRPLPKLMGSIEDYNNKKFGPAQRKKIEKARRGNVLVIDEHGVHLQKTKQGHHGAAPSPVFQNWKDLVNLVRSWLPPELQEFAKVVYDPTVIISGTITPDHVDEINAEGPGEVIVNLCLNGDGLLIFSSEANTDADFVGCYMPPNSWIAFTGHLRCAGTHQVLRLESKPVKLDFNLKKPRSTDRIVLCFRLERRQSVR